MKYAIPILLLLACAGCFLKSDDTGTADDIIREILYTDKAGSVLLSHEKIFHATSKESGGGTTSISGYTHTRLSAYDVKDGHLLNRHVFGDEQDQATSLLTITGDTLWYITCKDKRFKLAIMHARTLENMPLPTALLQQAPFLDGHLFQTDWYQLKQYFLFDPEQGIVLTDEQGMRHTLDPRTLKIADLNDPGYQPFFIKTSDATTGYATQDDSIVFQLNGDPRKHIIARPGERPLGSDPGFLKGMFLADMTNNHPPGSVDKLLQPAPGRFFVLHATTGAKDAQLLVSYQHWQPGSDESSLWQTTLQDIFYDPNNAQETNAFKTVFSSGNPTFHFKWADHTQQQLLLTWMLHTVCIDLATGKVQWKIRH